jgi:hypothetical protein
MPFILQQWSINRQAFLNKRNTEARLRNHFCRWKPVSIRYSECVTVTLVIQHTTRMRRNILSSAACLAVPYFPHYLINCTNFGKGYWIQNAYFDFFWNISYSKKNLARYHHRRTYVHVKYQLFLSDFSGIWIFSADFRKTLTYQISWKSLQWEQSCTMRKNRPTERQTWRSL